MRKTFVDKLTKLVERDPKVVLIVADVGFSYVDEFAKKYPNNFLNVGVTEQTMMGMAAGMALSGYKPWVYTMINFAIMRPYEQLRNDVCFNNANVKVIGVKGSEHYKFLGFSHNLEGTENENDLLKNLPNMHQHYPTSKETLSMLMDIEYGRSGPAYFRI